MCHILIESTEHLRYTEDRVMWITVKVKKKKKKSEEKFTVLMN